MVVVVLKSINAMPARDVSQGNWERAFERGLVAVDPSFAPR